MLDFGQYLQICRFSSNISKNLDFGQNFKKISVLEKIKFRQICRKISILDQNCLKFSIFIVI